MRFKPQYRIVIIYLIFGLLWIYFSDMLIEFIDTSLSIRVLQNIKGFVFIITTALLLFFLIRGDVRKLERANLEVVRSYEQSMRGWVHMLDLRNKEINHHTQRVTEKTKQLALYAGISGTDLWGVEKGALLHDIGKIGIPDSILIKPGPLTEEEWRVMKTHPTIAKDMLSEIDHLNPTVQIPYSHHERWDGKGYPQGLKGEEIPLAARIFSVIDVWDALTHDRVYKKAWSNEQALKFIREGAGTQFDPRLVQLFTDKLPELLENGLKKT